jgi:hypothetical protein
MSNTNKDLDFFNLRKEGKLFISKVFNFPTNPEKVRNVNVVFENSDDLLFGELENGMAIRVSNKGKKQVVVLVSQDNHKIKRFTLQRFDERKNGEIVTSEEHSFTFRGDEFEKLLMFLKSIDFIDFSNYENFQIEDLSTSKGNKVIFDIQDKDVINYFNKSEGIQREKLLEDFKENLTVKDINILLGRRQGLEILQKEIESENWNEKEWQTFFESQKWIFGIGLDYRVMSVFDREMNLSAVGTDNKEKVIVDFLMTFSDYTVIVEIKKPDTPIFLKTKNRSGTWTFHSDFIEAISQVLEQKAEWLILSQNNNLYNKEGNKKLIQRTRNAKAILVIGNKSEFLNIENIREREIKQDTFELFRQETRNIEIITYDELLERTNYIVNE